LGQRVQEVSSECSAVPTSNRFQLLDDEMDVAVDSIEENHDQNQSEPSAGTDIHQRATSTETLKESQVLQTNIACLKPATLMVLQLKIGSSSVRALIDSGASENLVKESVIPPASAISKNSRPAVVRGLGQS